MDDLLNVNKLVTEFIQNPSSVAAILALQNILDERGNQLELDRIPLGMHFKIPHGSLPQRFEDQRIEYVNTIYRFFDKPEIPTIIPELIYMSQVVYGSWRHFGADNRFNCASKKRPEPSTPTLPLKYVKAELLSNI